MSRSRKQHPLLEKVRIDDVAAEGKALARVNDKVVFTAFAVPGDVVDIQVTRRRKSYMEGYITQYHELSPMRVEPFCEHFGLCGGCKWQNLPYGEQLKFKQKQVEDQLTRIGKVQIPPISPILGSKNVRFYRNKLEFTFSDSRWVTRAEIESGMPVGKEPALGFHIPGMFDRVFDVRNCYLQPEPSNSIRLAVKEFAVQYHLTFNRLREKKGFLRNMIIRTTRMGDVMVLFVFGHDDETARVKLFNFLLGRFPQITSLCYVLNGKVNDTINDLEVVNFYGNSYIMEEMEGIRFRIGPKSFYQTNPEQAYELYKVVRSFARLTGCELVYDLYTGTGTIANFIAPKASKVIGIEYVPEAIDDAKLNSSLNGITNTLFFAGDIKDILSESFIDHHGNPDVVILDPPRAGVHTDVVQALLKAEPNRIVYVSCNPATQARDIAMLDADYSVTQVQPVDMFPHTHHVENVVLLQRRA